MNQHIKFPSIEQFRHIVQHVRSNAQYHGVPVPTVRFTGTVKLHGSNHAVCQDWSGEIYTQSRERLTTPLDDNAGSSAWTHANLDKFKPVFDRVHQLVSVNEETIQIFGEWCGGNIQKGVGMSHLPKQFIVFGIRVSKDSDHQLFLVDDLVKQACGSDLDCILNYQTWELDIDFNRPELAQQKLVEITESIEKDCPVARQQLGSDYIGELIGEGAVWTAVFANQTIRFKVKGTKHSSSKVKTLAAVDIERVNSINEFVDSVVTESRLKQGLEHVPDRDVKNIGAFIKWVVGDVIKEEMDTMLANGFTTKDVSSKIANAARTWFLCPTYDQESV